MPKRYLHGPMTWEVMQRNAWKDIANLRMKETEQLYKVATPCMDDHQFREEENGSAGDLSTVCSQNVLKCVYLVRIGRPDILWSVNKLARAGTTWTKACDKRLAPLISYKHHTCDHRQYCYVGNHSTTMPVHFRKSHVRTIKLDVQETDFSFTQFYGS